MESFAVLASPPPSTLRFLPDCMAPRHVSCSEEADRSHSCIDQYIDRLETSFSLHHISLSCLHALNSRPRGVRRQCVELLCRRVRCGRLGRQHSCNLFMLYCFGQVNCCPWYTSYTRVCGTWGIFFAWWVVDCTVSDVGSTRVCSCACWSCLQHDAFVRWFVDNHSFSCKREA